MRNIGGEGSGRAALEMPARRAPLDRPESDRSQAEVLRELGWTLAGCALVIVAVNIVAAFVARH